MNAVISVENISKQYRLGQVGTGTISHDLNRWWHSIRGKEDPYLKLGETNDRTKKSESEYVWALRDINFDVQQGEVLGIIGRNGAGKSTLLKILSRTTAPTTGQIKIKGRVASLLEVGTGFHPELSGRENVFLNGAILGMTKHEIKSKFDEIVDFAGIELYIDTPVKRYSSGMYVRLAFAVAAHLEPEILVIDEVLAVGDAEFQKKCMGKMKDVSGQGRTVLFVSHNMTAINSLCTRCVYLKNGKMVSSGNTIKIVNEYLSIENIGKTSNTWEKENKPGDNVAILHSARIIDKNNNTLEFASIDQEVGVEFTYEVLMEGYFPGPNIHVVTGKQEYAFVSAQKVDQRLFVPGIYKTTAWIPANLLNEETYVVGVAVASLNPVIIHFFEKEALIFEVIEDITKRQTDFNQKLPGVLRPQLNWNTIQI